MKIYPSIPILHDNRILPNYNTCAYVSSSDWLLGKNLGKQIDSADLIARANDAPTQGYERDVGSRTDLRVQSQVDEVRERQFVDPPYC